MNNVILTKQSSLVDKKMYFTAVLNLSKTGEEFPVDFDEVWQMVYSAKNKAVAELKDKFLQNVDYQLIDQKVHASNPQGYVWEHKYYLTVSCLEFFIARKDREVFEIYRQVFHHVANGDFSQPQQPKSQQEKNQILTAKMKVASWAIKTLNMNEASKLAIVKSIADPLGLPTPDYVESKGAHLSAKDLLAKHEASISSIKFNDTLVKLGYLTTVTRKAAGGKDKSFKVITEKGAAYGENMVSPHNQSETQPHWYIDKFAELLEIVKKAMSEGKEESHD